MSFRVGTPNYGLPQTEGTDKRDWSDTNQPFLLIDTAIKNAVDTSATASAAAATAQQTADNATTAASHAQTDATTAQTLATSASELATLAKNKADANELAIAQINGKLPSLLLSSGNETWLSFGNKVINLIGSLDEQERNRITLSYGGNEYYRLAKFFANEATFFGAYAGGSNLTTRCLIISTSEAVREDASVNSNGASINEEVISAHQVSAGALKIYRN